MYKIQYDLSITTEELIVSRYKIQTITKMAMFIWAFLWMRCLNGKKQLVYFGKVFNRVCKNR